VSLPPQPPIRHAQAGQAQLRVAGQEQPLPQIGLLGAAYARGGPPERLLEEAEVCSRSKASARRQLVRLLVAGISAGKRREDKSTEVRITYRFDPPDEAAYGDAFVDALPNPTAFRMVRTGCSSPAAWAGHPARTR
jgi:hypothetical protein